MVESQPSKLLVAGSIPVSRSRTHLDSTLFSDVGVMESQLGGLLSQKLGITWDEDLIEVPAENEHDERHRTYPMLVPETKFTPVRVGIGALGCRSLACLRQFGFLPLISSIAARTCSISGCV